jgi:Tol biopolymer transport system component
MCLILVIVLVISAATLADIASVTNTKAEQHFEKGNELLKCMDYEAAITEYNKVINLSSNSKIAQNAQYWIGQSHFKAGQFDAAQATFAKLIEQYPESAIVPVTKLMVERVQQTKKNEEKRRVISDAADKGFIIDPDTGVRYTKTVAFTGKKDVIEYTTHLNLSPNGKFLLIGKLVVPLDGSDPFDLVDTPAYRGTWSPDGKKVALYSGGTICMVPVSPETGRPTGPVRKLIDGNYKFQTKVSWSPDSEKLVFRRDGNIWILSVKDGLLAQITSHPGREGLPAWSPDGKTIAYGMKKDKYKDRYTLCLISAEGGVPREIIERRGSYVPSWSPDGKWILYKEKGKIHLFGLNDNQELEIIPPVEIVGDFFSWSPDGRNMLFYRPSYGYKYDIKVVSTSGGPPFDLGRQVTLYPEHSWSPDSKMIVAGGKKEDGRYGVWVSPLSGGDPALIEMDVSVDGKPLPFAVSPDTKKLAFGVKRDDGTEDLFVVPISLQDARTTGPAIKVFDGWCKTGLGYNVVANWSSDGTKLAVIHKGDLWIAPTNGDKPIQITRTPELELWPGWSPDGKLVNYEIFGQHVRPLYVVPASGGKATKILDVPGNRKYAYGWSPDSKKLAVVLNDLISIVPIAGGDSRQIAKLKDLGLDWVSGLRWSPDGKSIACVGYHIEKGDSGPIFVIPAEGGESTTLVTDDDSLKYSLSWSSDGKWIAYSSGKTVKVRPEGTMWEADFGEIVKKASR